MNFVSRWIAPLVLISASVSASADQTYDWSWADGTNTGSGTLTASGPLSPGGVSVTSISGLWDSQAITGLLIPFSVFANDNILYSGPQSLDQGGLAFQTATDQIGLFEGVYSSTLVSEALVYPDANMSSVLYSNALYALSLSPVGAVAAPEIDPASIGSGVTMLLGGLVVLRGRRPQRLVG